MRTMGDILLDLEKLMDEFYLQHDLQTGDVMSLVYNMSIVHYPENIEEYTDGTSPIFYYGPKDKKDIDGTINKMWRSS